VDLVVMVDVYHELAFPYEVLASVMKSLKPGGRIAFVEYKVRGPARAHPAAAQDEPGADQAGGGCLRLVWERTVGTLPWQHLVVFRKRG